MTDVLTALIFKYSWKNIAVPYIPKSELSLLSALEISYLKQSSNRHYLSYESRKDSITVWLLSPYSSYCIFHTAVCCREGNDGDDFRKKILARIVKVTFYNHYHHKSGGLLCSKKELLLALPLKRLRGFSTALHSLAALICQVLNFICL